MNIKPFLLTVRQVLPLCLLCLLTGAGTVAGAPAYAANFTVMNNADSGAGSLREAINNANNNANPNVTDTITFDPTFFNAARATTLRTIPLISQLSITQAVNLTGPTAGATVAAITSTKTVSEGRTVWTPTTPFSTFKVSAGVNASFSNMTISDSTYGIDNAGTVNITNCTLCGNVYGLRNNGTANVTNCTVYSNQMGIVNYRMANITHCTLCGNGGAGLNNAGTAVVRNSLIVGNADPIPNATLAAASSNNITTGTANEAGLQTKDGSNDLVLKNNGGPTFTLALVRRGTAVNAGNDALAKDANGDDLTTDQRGTINVRKFGIVDIGAYEAQGILPTIVVSNDRSLAPVTPGAPVPAVEPGIGSANGNASPGASPASPPAQPVTPEEEVQVLRRKVTQQEKELNHLRRVADYYGMEDRAVKAPHGCIVLAKDGMECIALQFVERVGDKYKYRWFVQSDGSMDFSKDNVRQGEVELFEKFEGGRPIGNTFIKQGTFNLEWSIADDQSGWIYYSPYSTNGQGKVQLAIVGPVDPREIKGQQANWYSKPPKAQ